MGALEAFLVVARSRTLAAASGYLNLSVSALSRRIQALETHVGRPLFERLHHELRLTADGQWLLEQTTAAYDTLAQVLGELRDSGANSLRLGVPPSFATSWLLPRLGRFTAAHPEIELKFDSSGTPFSKLGTSLDAIIVFSEEVFGDFYTRALRPQKAFAVCAPGLVPEGEPMSETLRRHPVLVHDGLPKVLPLWTEALGLAEPPARTQQYDNGTLQIAAAENGLGLALVLEDAVRFYPGEARLVRPFGEAVLTPYSYHFVCKKSAFRGLALRRFHDWIFGGGEEQG